MPRCIAKKDNGTQCKCNARKGSSFCGTHADWTDVYDSGDYHQNTVSMNTHYCVMSDECPNFQCITVDDVPYQRMMY